MSGDSLNFLPAGMSMRSCSVLLLVGCFAMGESRAADPPRPPLPEAVRLAVATRQIVDSDNLGDASARLPYRGVAADGGVLVGLEVALARHLDSDVPYAIRPIYRAGEVEWFGRPAGDLTSRRVRRVVTVVAKEGYAVGGIWVRSGAALDRVCLHYVRVRDGGLDVADNYASEWVGNSNGGAEKYVHGRGRPIVGLFADANEEQARNLGLIFARVPPAPAKIEGPNADNPAPPPGSPTATVGPSKLELEAHASRAQQEQQAPVIQWTGWIPFVLAGVLFLTLILVFVFVLGRKEDRTTLSTAERSGRPIHELDGQPLSERPVLARRIDPYLPGTRAKKERLPVSPPEDPTQPSSIAPLRLPKDPPRPVMSASQPVVALPTPTPEDRPPFFLVRATYRSRHNRMTRVYVLENELLIMDAGPGADLNQTAGLAAAAVSGGGLIGALVGGAGGTMVADGQKTRGEVFQQKLDELDLGGLLQRAREEGNFRARFDDLVGLAIDPPPPPSVRREKSRAIGTLRFRHLERGEFTFEFLSPEEIRGAVEMIRHSDGSERLLVGDGWDQVTAGFLAGV